jgi:hypothetical protein
MRYWGYLSLKYKKRNCNVIFNKIKKYYYKNRIVKI